MANMLPQSFPAYSKSHLTKKHRQAKGRWNRLFLEALEPRTVLSTFTVINTNTQGDGSLFDAITKANNHANEGGIPDTIAFNIPGGGVQTISPPGALPIISDSVIIDGSSQPGYTPGHPLIDIDGSQAGVVSCLEFHVSSNTVKGLIINNYKGSGGAEGFAIVLDGINDLDVDGIVNNTIQANFIGIDALGTTAAGNQTGILIHSSSHNLIGGLNEDGRLVQGNLISGNIQSGIFIDDDKAHDNQIEGNYIGTDLTGLKPVGNGLDGIFFGPPQSNPDFGFASGNLISNVDRSTGTFNPDGRNVIAGNKQNGISILGGSLNQVKGNYIGVGADGATAIPNLEDGIRIEDASNNEVGDTAPDSGNVISGNMHNGIQIISDAISENLVVIAVGHQSATGNTVHGNMIGTNAPGMAAVPNQNSDADGVVNFGGGIVFRKLTADPSAVVSGNLIGGDDAADKSLDGVIKARNVISGNLDNGIVFLGAGVNLNTIQGNLIGTNLAGDTAIPNSHEGILFNGINGQSTAPSNNLIGGASPGAGNLISGNGTPENVDILKSDGIRLANNSNANSIQGNRIGTQRNGIDTLPNFGSGVLIDNSALNIVGGDLPEDQNVIGGNKADGVSMLGPGAKSNRVQRNLIGIGIDLTTAIANTNGVSMFKGATSNLIGGTENVGGQDISLGNSIASNQQEGIRIDDGSNSNQVIGNIIGTDVSFGSDILGNFVGIGIFNSANNIIGGATSAARNYIVNNGTDGIDIVDVNALADGAAVTTVGNVVQGNYIGIIADGETALANGGDGIAITAAVNNMIGGGVPGSRNVISGNVGSAISIGNKASSLNTIAGNYIGTDATGRRAIGNLGGINISDGAFLNTIGTTDDSGGNLISGNRANGLVFSNAGLGNLIQQNFIGVDADGMSALPNTGSGILIRDTPGTIIDGGPNTNNVIAGNGNFGIAIGGPKSVGNVIRNASIGNFADDSIPNKLGGILLTSIEGSSGAPSATLISANNISGNAGVGLVIAAGATANHITQNLFGVSTSLFVSIPNVGFAIRISDSPGNFIGGSDAGNLIADTALDPQADTAIGSGYGILISGADAKGNRVLGNVISGNANEGIRISDGASENVIGGPTTLDGNAILDNFAGVAIVGAGTNKNTVDGNLIGLNSKGEIAGNLHDGVFIGDHASANVIGDAIPDSPGNVIAANGGAGVMIVEGASENTVVGNSIGTDRNGKLSDDFGNVGSGIVIQDSGGNIIGGEVEGTTNVVADNKGSGIVIGGASSTQNIVKRNSIRKNKIDGVLIDGASHNMVGGPHSSDGNLIDQNGVTGVVVQEGTNNSIQQNLILENRQLGIDLGGDGPTPNDPRPNKDADGGANNLQNTPTLTFATFGASQRIVGSLESAAQTTFTIEFFAGPADPNQTNAKRFVTSTTVTSNASGVGFFDVFLPATALALDEQSTILVATATDTDGNTSEFSNPVQILADGDGDGVPDDVENSGPDGGDGNGLSSTVGSEAWNSRDLKSRPH